MATSSSSLQSERMPDFTYSTELSIQGPWLLSRSSLEELDQIFDRVWLEHRDRREKAIADEVDQMVSDRTKRGLKTSQTELASYRERADSYAYRSKRSTVIELGPTKSLQAETIREAIGNLAASDERPKGIRVSITIGELDAAVSLGQAAYERDRLRVRVSPETTSASRELFGSLRQWAETYQPPAWQRIWARIGWFLWIPWIFIVVLMLLTALPDEQRAARQAAGEAADKLLRDGITPNEVPAAIDLLLRVQTGRVIAPSAPSLPRWFWIIVFVGLLTIVALQIRPRAVIGMGSGEEMIRRWRTWLRIVGVTVPSAILGSIVVPYIVDVIRHFLQS
jgi:hypothetical protein